MCGRFTLTTPPEQIARSFELEETPALAPRYNIAPGQNVAVVRRAEGSGSRVLEMFRWGLVPHWARDPRAGSRMINARSETVAEKPAFREAFRRRRCLVPADAFFEWRAASRQPFRIYLRDGVPFGFAGLWESWTGEDGEVIASCTLLTTEANADLRELHDRMPVILDPDDYATWLDPERWQPEALQALLRPRPAGEMQLHPVPRRVNRPAHDDLGCIAPVAREPDEATQLGFDLGSLGGGASADS